ncbi:type ISP restriction/modification enzyme [Candidatus Parabeggiatoa sp. HSG14]|uniref:type ISP restriction/modification enzyme n=2 Tax=Candidatus Parabeggiatoa sp. HSG14 TaxID=3055593 RepID=UPI0025A7173C|nr:N-6 DNA methylase [Thiotrichales bacterium HSG14]
MSRLQIQTYYKKLESIIQHGGSRNEQSIRGAFENLLNSYCEPKNFIVVPELYYKTKKNTSVRLDGIVKDALRLAWGYWEAKDELDDLDKEIETKFFQGYPNDNIIFEDSQTAVLIQSGSEVLRINMKEPDKLDKILNQFINYERPEVQDFRQAIEQFRADLPTVVEALRSTIASQTSKKFLAAFKKLFKLCQESINPKINEFDIREMIIQHILTEDIFLTVFNESQFHRENVIAKELESVVNTFFTGKVRRETLKSIESYYAVIRREAANISNHHEKQKFLKVIYENFYKTYNPKGADRLGIVYTPNEIVQFMIRSTDYLLDKHFNRLLSDDNVSILDPATGTGTFITELIEYLPISRLPAKYKNEIHCNEVAILPYYIANLNIEYTYQQKMGEYEEFSNICFVDTLDNVGFAHGTGYKHQQSDLSLGLGEENAKRIEEQNKRKISVIIGNPPYNANQQNENDNNKNREYPAIDNDIKRTYVEGSSTQNLIKIYDMYARFLRWASNRIDKNGVIAFVSNSSFLEARTYDGFRKVVAEEFNAIYAIDLKGNARTSGERRRKESGNVFSDAIRVGIAVYFLIKDEKSSDCKIYYNAIRDYAKADEKKEYLRDNTLDSLNFERIMPDKNHNWLNIADNDFDDLLLLANKETKLAKSQKEERAIFKLFSLGSNSGADEWFFDFNEQNLINKGKFFVDIINKQSNIHKNKKQEEIIDDVDNSIKWTRELRKAVVKGYEQSFNKTNIRPSMYRPFTKKYYHYEPKLLKCDFLNRTFFSKNNKENQLIAINTSSKVFNILSSKYLVDLHFTGDTQCLPLYRYDSEGNRTDNITDWGLNQFQTHYQDNTITKENIFHYTYAVLHNPAYRQKYELNLKREFPRLPFYEDFSQWVNWGKQLMDLHLNYEKAKKYKLKQIDIETKKQNKPKLKADKEAGKIYLDQITTLQGIPPKAWDYKLGNRSALEWILDQYKEKNPRDKSIAEKFNTYRFADYKEHVIDLLKRVCTVSVETMKIIEKMPI